MDRLFALPAGNSEPEYVQILGTRDMPYSGALWVEQIPVARLLYAGENLAGATMRSGVPGELAFFLQYRVPKKLLLGSENMCLLAGYATGI